MQKAARRHFQEADVLHGQVESQGKVMPSKGISLRMGKLSERWKKRSLRQKETCQRASTLHYWLVKRGRQSAAMYVVKPKAGYGGYLDRWLDYRVDDHDDPVPRLAELLEMHDLYFGKSPETEHVEVKGKVLEQVTGILRQAGYLKNGKGFTAAFKEFIGNENFEERADPEGKWIDRPVLKYLVKKFQK
jgi:uncharacterized Ntn-hydrolase superfamily protein